MKEMEYDKTYGVTEAEFTHYVGRKPKNRNEFGDWAYKVFKGIDAQIDWDMAMEEAANFSKDE